MPYKSRYTVEIPQCNILSYLFDNIRGDPNAPIWIDAKDNSNSLSRDQAFSLIQRLAVGFDRHGVGEGEAVMVFSPNHIFVPLVYLAAAGSKRFFTGANPAYTVNEVAYQMSTVKAALILIHPSLIEIGQAAARKANILPERLFLFADTQSTSPGELRDWRELLAPEADAARWRCDPLRGDEASKTIAAINFSSGTTGMPKGVCVTHHNLVANTAQTIFNFFESTPYSEDSHPAERWLAFLPLYHAYSQLWTINIACRLQVPVYVMSKFALEDFLQYIEKFQITTLQAVPPVLVMLNKREEAKKYSLASLRQILSGAAPLSLELQNEVSAKFDVVISQGWGMTETTCVGMLMPGRENDMTGSVGYLVAHTEAMLIDDNDNEVQSDDTPGELWLRGPQVMLKYWDNERETRETKTEAGWLKTGDIAITRKDKFFIVDRKKELIKVNGLQVAPAELEAVLLENENIADAGVVGVTLDGNEFPRAYVVLQTRAQGITTSQDIQKFVADRVAKHKRLAGGVQVVPEVPRLASGKILRKQLREWAKRDAGKIKPKL